MGRRQARVRFRWRTRPCSGGREEPLCFLGCREIKVHEDVVGVTHEVQDPLCSNARFGAGLGHAVEGGEPDTEIGDGVLDV